jgi:hypothetical protein
LRETQRVRPEAAVPDVDVADLSRAVGRPVTSYDVEAINPHLRFHSVTGGVYRITTGSSSLVVKVVRRGDDGDSGELWVSGADPSHRNYWKREWLAFDSGVLVSLPGRLRAPRCLLTTQPRDGECWIWMEDVRGRPASSWSLDDFSVAARHLGGMQGAFAASTLPLPEHEWLSRQWLHGWVDACAPLVDLLGDDASLADDRLAPLRPLRQRIVALWPERKTLLGIVDEAPQTVVHCDLWGDNLFACEDTTVAIDWSQVGIGSLAQDLDQMTLDTVWMPVRPEESLAALESAIVPSYVAGLRDSGFDVAEMTVRRWYAAAASAHYAWMAGMVARRARQPDQVRGHEQRWGRSYASIVATRAHVLQRAVELGEWALESQP